MLITFQLISPWCHIYASVNLVSIGSDNGVSPIRRQGIICTNAELITSKVKVTFDENVKIFIHEIASENIVCEMAAILSRGRWVKG